MKLFTVGPTQMFEKTLDCRNEQLPYFRTKEFSKITLDTVSKLNKLLLAPKDVETIYLTGSGTAALEMVVSNSFNENDNLLIINGGTFGARFVELANIYNLKYSEIKLEYGEILTEKHFATLDLSKFTALLVNLHETSTGQLYDLKLISNICQENNILLITDIISTFLADKFDMDGSGVSCAIISSQKALALSPGLSFIAMTKNFYNNKVKNNKPKNLYFDINKYVENMKRGQCPFTPAVGTILELNNRLDDITLEDELKRVEDNANYFRKEIIKKGFTIPTYPLSNALTPVIIPNDKATKLFDELKDRYDIFINPTGGELANKIIRIAHIGNLKKNDYDELINDMEMILK